MACSRPRLAGRRGLVIAAALICVCEPFLRVFAVARGGLWWGPYTWLSADELALGALLAIFTRTTRGSRGNVLRLAGLSALVGVAALAASFLVPAFIAISLRATCVNYGSLGLLCAVLWLGTGTYRSLVNNPFLSLYGFISYGLYLIHALIIKLYNDVSMKFTSFYVGHSFEKCLLRLLITFIVATAIAYLSRTTYEEFFLQMKDKLDSPRESPQSVPRAEPLLPT